MSKRSNLFFTCWTVLARQALRLRADQRGNVAIIMGFAMVPIVGALGIGFEISNWYMTKHAMQNAADAATIAAATNGSSNYNIEAAAVAAQYGFVNGSNNVTVTASKRPPAPLAATPATASRSRVMRPSFCPPWWATRAMPLSMARVSNR